MKTAVDDAASVGGGLWLSYLFVLFYLAVAAGAVTHADLFLENPVKLPFLNVELPLLAFFFLAPILFLFVHAYTLVHLVFLTDKAKRFDQALSTQIGDDSVAAKDSNDPRIAAIAGVRGQLPSNIFIQFLAGPRDRRAGSFGWLLRAIAWSTLAVAPILLLLLFQLQFLPFHNSWITWTHRLALVADLVLIWWLWRKILSGREVDGSQRHWIHQIWSAAGLALSLAVVVFSGAVATFPLEWQEHHLPSAEILPAVQNLPAQLKEQSFHEWIAQYRHWAWNSDKVSLHDWVFKSPIDRTTRRRWFPFSSTLVLPGLNIYEGLKIDDPEKAKWRDYVFRVRGREFTGAILDLAILPKVDFSGAELGGASLKEAQLQGASLANAQLRNASLDGAQLQGASLNGARLQGASLDSAQLQGVSLDGDELQGAALNYAELEGASLYAAQLQGASFFDARLQGASLFKAELQGASLFEAQLQGAALRGANLQGALLSGAQLQGASLQEASLLATDLSQALLWRTNAAPFAYAPDSRAAVRLSDSTGDWEPVWRNQIGEVQPWNDRAYQDLRKTIESIPAGDLREQALDLIRSLDCADPRPMLASCDPSVALPPEAVAWREALEAASVDDNAYRQALAKVLRDLVCSGGDDAIYVVRGSGFRPAFQDRIRAAGAAALGLIADLMNKDSKDCPVAAALTEADWGRLLQMKQAIEAAEAKPAAK